MVLWASCLGKPQAADSVAVEWRQSRTTFYKGGQGTISDLLKVRLISVADLKTKNFYIANIEPYFALMPTRYKGDAEEILKDEKTWAEILESPASRTTFFELEKLKTLFKDDYETARKFAASVPVPIACGILAGYSIISKTGVPLNMIKSMGRSMFMLSGGDLPELDLDGYSEKVWQDFKESDFKPLRDKILKTHYGKKTSSKVAGLQTLLKLVNFGKKH